MSRAAIAALALAVVLGDGCNAVIGVPDATLSDHLSCNDGSCTCEAPYTYCTEAFEGTCTIDVETDPENCGRCGHSCLGGACSQGACQPVVLDSTTQPLGLSLFGGLLWLGVCGDPSFPTAAVATESTAGGAPKAAIASPQCLQLQQLIGDTLYWGSTTTLFASKLDPVTSPTMVTSGNAGAIDANATNLYWAGLDAMGDLAGVFRASLPTGAPVQLSASVVGGIHATPTGVFWITQANGIHFVADTGVTDTTVSSASGDFLIGDATQLYYSDETGIYAQPIAGGTPKLIAPTGSMAAAFVDGNDLFWLDDGTSTVDHVSTTGGPVTVLAKGFSFCSNVGIAADATAVYWLAGTPVAKVAR